MATAETHRLMHFLVEIIFDTVRGWIGHHFVRLVTLGLVNLDWGEGSESVVAQWIGLFVFVGLVVLIGTLAG